MTELTMVSLTTLLGSLDPVLHGIAMLVVLFLLVELAILLADLVASHRTDASR